MKALIRFEFQKILRRRSTLIVLTEKGKARAYEVLDERQKAASDFCARLTEEEKDTLILLLDKLLGE